MSAEAVEAEVVYHVDVHILACDQDDIIVKCLACGVRPNPELAS